MPQPAPPAKRHMHSLERAPEVRETERAPWRGEEPYSRTVTTPDAGIAKVSRAYGARSMRSQTAEPISCVEMRSRPPMSAVRAPAVMAASTARSTARASSSRPRE